MTPPSIFDRTARRLRRDMTAGAAEAFFTGLMIDELLDRLDSIARPFADALVVGAEPRLVAAVMAKAVAVTVVDPAPRRVAALGGIASDEDRDVYGVAAFDLVIACGTLDTVDDLPGTLALLRRALRPDGAFLAAFPGAPSLPSLRKAATAADADAGVAVARFHPQIEVRAAGDLLVRASFALPVADLAQFNLSYAGVDTLLSDLRAAALRNVLARRVAGSRRWRRALAAAFATSAAEDGRTRETFSLIVLTAWAPAPGQPRPAARGSGIASLAAALQKPR